MIKVKSDEEYISLLKKANKDLGDLVRERDVQITTLKSALREALGDIEAVFRGRWLDEQGPPIHKAITTINEALK